MLASFQHSDGIANLDFDSLVSRGDHLQPEAALVRCSWIDVSILPEILQQSVRRDRYLAGDQEHDFMINLLVQVD